MLGVMSAQQAQKEANDRNLDLVKVSPNAQPPVCKLLDYGKFKFDQAKKLKESKKNQVVVDLKEIRLSVAIDIGDINIKVKNAIKFLEKGDKVKVSVRMRGRQQAHPDIANKVLEDFYERVKDYCVVSKKPARAGRIFVMFLSPAKPKK